MSGKVFLGGVPYALDVKKLEDKFPVPTLSEGRVISHADLEEVLGIVAKSQRYYGVVNSWIKRMKHQNGIFMTWEQTAGVKILNPAEVLHFSETRTRQKARQTVRAAKNFAWVDRSRLDSTGQQRYDHQVMHANRLAAAIAEGTRQMAVELAPVKSLPKPKLIREAS